MDNGPHAPLRRALSLAITGIDAPLGLVVT
jgi:hypothetical protein